MSGVNTETVLREWRYGSVQAERLAASILRLERYRNIEPQAPLGGGDDGADILCDRGGRLWVGAVFFPPTNQNFKAIQKKFGDDFLGAKKRKRHGIVFITNQRMTRGERRVLVDLALEEQQECIIYDVERIAGVLDSAEGYGIRVGYLRIPMSAEEQISFFANRENSLGDMIAENSNIIQALATQVANLSESQRHVAHSVDLIAKSQDIAVEPLRAFDPLAMGEIASASSQERALVDISPDAVLLVHRLVCFELPPRMIGRFRQELVFIQKPAEISEEPPFSPPKPAEVPKLVAELCSSWRSQYDNLSTFDQKLEVIAEFFHKLLVIHPFLDGNGRVARSLLMQQCIELFGRVDMSRFNRGVDYYNALLAADQNDFMPLQELVRRAVSE